MKLKKGETLLEVRNEFGKLYPGLKLECFEEAHEVNESSENRSRILGSVVLDAIVTCDLPVEVNINATMTVGEVEQVFHNATGLHVQVFRKMNGVWIETVQTDHYSLEKQMELSKNSVHV
ncbi:MAG: hypothetical protein JJ975_01595 [Bacteroidia bacterium]|nr:hypothetical protein [Bacteroidia bacterium]